MYRLNAYILAIALLLLKASALQRSCGCRSRGIGVEISSLQNDDNLSRARMAALTIATRIATSRCFTSNCNSDFECLVPSTARCSVPSRRSTFRRLGARISCQADVECTAILSNVLSSKNCVKTPRANPVARFSAFDF